MRAVLDACGCIGRLWGGENFGILLFTATHPSTRQPHASKATRESHPLGSDQCDQIGRNFAILKKYLKSLGNFWFA